MIFCPHQLYGFSSKQTTLIKRSRRWSIVWGLFLATTMLVGCFSIPKTLPEPPPKTVAYAHDPQPGNLPNELSAQVMGAHPEDTSGFMILSSNSDALKWRLRLIDLAEETLDLQYYHWTTDASAFLILSRVIRAADRGVRIRILIDDILLIERDHNVAALSSHPQIDVRLFNPLEGRHGSTTMRNLEFAGRIEQLNHRMHNKMIVADNRLAIMGGRNVGNAYFGLNADHNMIDFDVLALGSVVPKISNAFDLFWNSEPVYPGEALIANHADPDLLENFRGKQKERLESNRDLLVAFQGSCIDTEELLVELQQKLYTGKAKVIYDEPLVSNDTPPSQLASALRELTTAAKNEILTATPYFVPDKAFYQNTADLKERGVRMVVLTNSLGATNQPVVHSGYKKHRTRVLDNGVALYEVRRDAAPAASPNTPPVTAEVIGLHAKFFVVDRHTLFVGSFNLDNRSIYLNTEIGLLIESPELAEAATVLFENLIAPETSWEVRKNEKDELVWQSGSEVRDSEPPSSCSQRFQSWFYGLFSLDEHL